jgi:hypothetical protein
MKQTENEIVEHLLIYFKQEGWVINSYCLGQTRGNDIEASMNSRKLIVEVKGAKADSKSPTKKREFFDSGQIKTHFGKAIVKILDEKHLNPTAEFAIAHPNDTDIREVIGHLIPFLKALGIKHLWVSSDGTVIEE